MMVKECGVSKVVSCCRRAQQEVDVAQVMCTGVVIGSRLLVD